MRPQILEYTNDSSGVKKLKYSDTFVVSSEYLQWGEYWPPTVFINGIDGTRIKFDFHKVYKNKYNILKHCEYRSVHGGKYKLIVYNNLAV